MKLKKKGLDASTGCLYTMNSMKDDGTKVVDSLTDCSVTNCTKKLDHKNSFSKYIIKKLQWTYRDNNEAAETNRRWWVFHCTA